MGKYDQFLAGISSTPTPSSRKTGKYDQFTAGLDNTETVDSVRNRLNDNPKEGEENPAEQRIVQNFVKVGEGYGMGELGAGIGKWGVKKGAGAVGGLINKFRNVRNAPLALEEALGAAKGTFGTAETPSMVGMTAREGLLSEEAANEALAQKLYGEVPKDIPVSTPRLTEKFREIGDELPANLKAALGKHIQLEPNPIRAGDIGTTNTKVFGVNKFDDSLVVPHQYTASPGTPTQLPPSNPIVGELIKLRSKLGAASKGGGFDGYNAGQLKHVLDEDIANLGAGEGPLGELTGEAVNQPLNKATSYYREMMQQQGNPLYKRLATGKVEDIPDMVFKAGRSQDVLTARAALGESGYQAAKKAFFNDIVASKDVGKVLAKYSQNNSNFLSTVFNASEIKSLQAIDRLQKAAMESARTVERAKLLIGGAGAAAVGGGIAGKSLKFALGDGK